ncbi:MAG: undecaprenyl/decaprenyl-phosphate alpha-N-acetylglucosaminyl 1-phosphate transferase, partial [Chloroflexi bacterium]|nr:undecaprenyl/decaprenyl-phosphate alpha-N-acetylglucosaminyl 1-phosphate transferase [Chloroflexota bacterium]
RYTGVQVDKYLSTRLHVPPFPMTSLVVFLLALLSTFLVTPLVMHLARHWRALDEPRDRHQHPQATPKLGGIALAMGFFVALLAAFVLPVVRNDATEPTRVIGLVLGLTVVLVVGIYDDRHELRAPPQFVAQFVAAVVVVFFGVRIVEPSTPFGTMEFPDWLAIPFTLLWLMGMMNTVNFLDGLDGLAAGVVGIACLILFVHTQSLHQDSIALLPLALLGAIVGFMPFNFSPAKIFLGSSGALFLGLALGALSIIGGAKVASALLVIGIPILDTAWQIVRRLRDGHAPYQGDRGHLHFRLVDRGWSQRQVVLLLYSLTAVFGGMALLLPSGMLKLFALLAMGVLMLALMSWLTRTRSSQ